MSSISRGPERAEAADAMLAGLASWHTPGKGETDGRDG
jgi:hypothetical protein